MHLENRLALMQSSSYYYKEHVGIRSKYQKIIHSQINEHV